MHDDSIVAPRSRARYFPYVFGTLTGVAVALAIIALIAALLWAVTGWWITKDVIWAVVLFVPLAPSISLLARVLWIYLDQTFDPEPSGNAHR